MSDITKTRAFDTYEFLERELSISSRQVEISIGDNYTLWASTAQCENRSCSVTSQTDWYEITFDNFSKMQTRGISTDRDEVVLAVRDWLDNLSLDEMYLKHRLIDRGKRYVDSIFETAVRRYPPLEKTTTTRWETDYSGHHGSLWLYAGDRSCSVCHDFIIDSAWCEFLWEDRSLMALSDSNERTLASALNSWLCDYSMPSQMKREFPLTKYDELAEYYESGRITEGEFVRSWSEMEELFNDSLRTSKDPRQIELYERLDESMRANPLTEHAVIDWYETIPANIKDGMQGFEGFNQLHEILKKPIFSMSYSNSLSLEKIPEILNLIAQMREQGYDKTLRARHHGAQEHLIECISVSRMRPPKRRLHPEQTRDGLPEIIFEFHEVSFLVHPNFDEEETQSYLNIEFTPQIDRLMKRLESKSIE